MAGCGGGGGGGGIHSFGSIRYCGRFCRTLIIFRITHRMLTGFQCVCCCAIRCLYHRCSIRVIMMIWSTIFQWMCKLCIGWYRLTLFMVLDKFIRKDELKSFDSEWIHVAWFDFYTHWMFACYCIEAWATQADGCEQTFVRQSCPVLWTVSTENMSTWSEIQLKK